MFEGLEACREATALEAKKGGRRKVFETPGALYEQEHLMGCISFPAGGIFKSCLLHRSPFALPLIFPPSLCSRSALHPLQVLQQINLLLPPSAFTSFLILHRIYSFLACGVVIVLVMEKGWGGTCSKAAWTCRPGLCGAETAALFNMSQMCSSNCCFNENTCTMLPA